MTRRRVVQMTASDLAQVFGWPKSVSIRAVRMDGFTDAIEVLVESPGFDEVLDLCEPPRFQLSEVLSRD